MSSPVPARPSRSSQDNQRRKRKARTPKNREPEPKEIVSGAGQPLDHSTRRDLEERLGHDFSRVRLHTDRNAGALADMLGADAVAVGQDIFFRDGAYRPGTAEGQRLLAHELVHTVQNPHGLGALRTGRDLGAVSLPQQAIEREAESATQSTSDTDVRGGEATPGWLRYTTVHADRRRFEELDPTTVVDRLANSIRRSLRGDPEDRSKRTRKQLARLPGELREAVLERLETRLLSSEQERVLDLVEEVEDDDNLERSAMATPAVEPDAEADLRLERETRHREAEDRQEHRDKPAQAAGPDKEQSAPRGAGSSTPENVGPSEQAASNEPVADEQESGSAEQQSSAEGPEQEDTDQSGESASEDKSEQRTGSGEQSEGGSKTDGEKSDTGEESGTGEQSEEEKPDAKGEDEKKEKKNRAGEQQDRAGEKEDAAGDEKKDTGAKDGAQEQRDASEPGEEESEGKNRPGAVDPLVGGKQKQEEGKEGRAGSPKAAGQDQPQAGAVSELEGTRNQDAEGPQEKPVSPPAGGDSEVDVGGGEDSAWDVKLQPEDFLPKQDLDVSGVPTADKLEPGSSAATASAVPSAPAPPPTKADQVHAERDAEDAEDEAEAQEEPEEGTGPPLESDPSVETEGAAAGGGLNDLAAERAAESGSDEAEQPKDPKSAADPEKGPADAQRGAQDAPGKTEGNKDEPGGAVKESAAKEEKQKPGDGKDTRYTAEGTKPDSETKKDAAGTKKDAAESGDKQDSDGTGQKDGGADAKDSAETSTSESDEQDTGKKSTEESAESESPSDSKDSRVAGGKNEQPGRQSSSSRSGSGEKSESGMTDSGASEQASGTSTSQPDPASKPKADSTQEPEADSAPDPKRTEEPARTADPSPKSPSPKDEASKTDDPKAGVPEKAAEEPKRPEAAEKKQAARPEPSKSGPAPEAPRGGGRGTAGGGGAKPAPKGDKGKKGPATPNLSRMSPEAGLRTASRLKPHQALRAMNGVDSAVDRTTGDEHKKLSSDPPSMQRPAGAPRTLEGKPKADGPAEYSNSPAQKADAPEKKKAEVKDQKKPEGGIPAEKVEEPSGWDTFMMGAGYAVGWIAEKTGLADVSPEDLAARFADLPTKDEALKEAKAGTAPGVEMQGPANQKSREQDEAVNDKGDETAKTGRDDTNRRMGEDQVYPKAPKEELRGKVPGRERGKGGGPAGGAGTGAVPEDAASEVAEHEHGKQYKSAFGKGEQGLADAKRKKDEDSRESKQKHRLSVDREVQKNTKQQAGQREQTVGDVTGERRRWRQDQDAELNKLGTKKSDKRDKAEKDVDKHEKDTDKKAEDRKKEDNDKIRKKGRDAESEAKSKRDETKNQAGNWVEQAFEWIKQKFVELRDKIISILRAARDKIIEFVENFKLDIEEMINKIRETIVNLVKKLVEELVELAEAMVRAIIELANKIRRFITELIERAIALVNKLAEQLKQLVNELLHAIAKLLSDILNVLKKALDAAIKAVKDAVKAVLDFASKMLSGLGQFMMVAVDFLRDPGGWLSGAKNSAEDGAKHHFFREVKNAVKTWFQQKIEEIIGLPKEILNRLIKGGLTLEWIVKQVWDAVVPQLPFIIGEIVITKVVAKLIPGAGWVMAVIDAIKTAIGALGEILRAFGAVLTWLQSVRKGGAGVLFAKAVAAGVVALLELAYEFLLSGIGKYVGKVGDRLKGIAKRIGTKGRRRPGRGQGGDGEDPRRGRQRPGGRTDRPGPAKTRPGEGRRGAGGRGEDRRGEGGRGEDRRGAEPGGDRRGQQRRAEDRRPDDRRNEAGRREEGRNEEDRQRQDDRVSPSAAARQAAHKPGGKPGPDRDGPKRDRDQDERRDQNERRDQRGRTETDQDRRRREDNDRERPDRDRPDRDPQDRDKRPDNDDRDSRDRKPTDRDDSPAGKDKDGKPKGKDDDKPDTSPTPNAKTEPKAETPRKPREDTDTKQKREDGTGTKQKHDKDKDSKDRDSDRERPKDRDPARTKGSDRDTPKRRDDQNERHDRDDTPNRRRDDDPNRKKDDDPHHRRDGEDPKRRRDEDPTKPKRKPSDRKDRKPKRDKDSDPKKPKRDDEDRNKPKHDKDKEATKAKQEKKDQRKKEEESKESKEDRLRKIVAKLTPKIRSALRHGLPRTSLNVTLSGFRAWYRLSSLEKEGSGSSKIWAALNPRLPSPPEDVEPVEEDVINLFAQYANQARASVQGRQANSPSWRQTGPESRDVQPTGQPGASISSLTEQMVQNELPAPVLPANRGEQREPTVSNIALPNGVEAVRTRQYKNDVAGRINIPDIRLGGYDTMARRTQNWGPNEAQRGLSLIGDLSTVSNEDAALLQTLLVRYSAESLRLGPMHGIAAAELDNILNNRPGWTFPRIFTTGPMVGMQAVAATPGARRHISEARIRRLRSMSAEELERARERISGITEREMERRWNRRVGAGLGMTRESFEATQATRLGIVKRMYDTISAFAGSDEVYTSSERRPEVVRETIERLHVRLGDDEGEQFLINTLLPAHLRNIRS